MPQNCYDICRGVVGQYVDFDGSEGAQCYDLANYVGKFFGIRMYGWYAANIVEDNPNLRNVADIFPFATADLKMGDMIVYGATSFSPAGHVGFYGYGSKDNSTCIDQNHPPSSPVTEHTFNQLALNPKYAVRFRGQDSPTDPKGQQNTNTEPGSDKINGKTTSKTYKFWEVTCEEATVFSEKGKKPLEKTFKCSKYTGEEDGDWIKIDRFDFTPAYIAKSCMKRKEDYDITVTKKDNTPDPANPNNGGNNLQPGQANYTGEAISYGGKTLSKEYISNMAKACAKYDIWLPGFIVQTYLETQWGQAAGAPYASRENNWGGLTWTGNPNRESGVVVSRGAPRAEGGYYMKFATIQDYFEDHCNLISDRIGGANAMYHANHKTTIDSFTRGLFRPVAMYNYAAVGLGSYLAQMNSIYAGMRPQLEEVMRHIQQGDALPIAPNTTNPTASDPDWGGKKRNNGKPKNPISRWI